MRTCFFCKKELNVNHYRVYFPDKYGRRSCQRFCSSECCNTWLRFAINRDMAEGIIYGVRMRPELFSDECFSRLRELVLRRSRKFTQAEEDMAVVHICVQTSSNERFRHALISIYGHWTTRK